MARAAVLVLDLVSAALVLAGCAACSTTTSAPSRGTTRACGLVVWHKPASASAHVEVVGDFNAWGPGLVPSAIGGRADGWRVFVTR